MKIKTLLLSSAAVVMAAGGAQAADLSIAEPVAYVLVCEAFGTGFWYIPGTDTCIKIGGSVEFAIKFRSASWNLDNHTSHWKFVTEATTSFMASSMTDYGRLDGFVKYIGKYDVSESHDAHVKLDEAWLKLGHVKMGHFGSASNQSGGFAPGAWRPDKAVNQIQLEWAAAGFGLYLGIEDPRERWGTELTDDDEHYSMPDIAGAITISQGHWDAKIAGAVGVIEEGGMGWDGAAVYGVSALVNVGADPFKLRGYVGFGTGSSFVGSPWGHGTNFANNLTAYISAIWQATAQIGLAGTFAYASTSDLCASSWFQNCGSAHATGAGLALIWTPVPGFKAVAEGKAWRLYPDQGQTDHNWEALVKFVREW